MAQSLRRPLLEAIEDTSVRQSVEWLYEYLREAVILRGYFEHREYVLPVGVAGGTPLAHGLPFIPKDAFFTFISDSTIAAPTFIFSRFDATNIYVASTNTSPLTIRLFVGRYQNEF